MTIGNSQGICIAKTFIEQTGLGEEIEIEVSGNTLVIRPNRPPRSRWGDAFHSLAAVGDDELLDSETIQISRWDDEEWEW